MDITIYRNTSDNLRVNKVLEDGATYACTIRREAQIENPVIEIVSNSDLRQYNYVYVPLYKRYYYATVTAGPNNTYTFSCKTDVLMSFKGQYMPKQCILKRSASLYNLYMNDGNFYISSKVRRQIKNFSGSLADPGNNIVLVTA